MQEPTRASENDHGDDELSPAAAPKQEHEKHPQKGASNSSNPATKFYRWLLPTHDKLNLLFTLVIAVATVSYVIVTKRQLDEMRASGAESDKQIKQLIEQAGKQATNTHELAVASRDQATASKTAAEAAKISADNSARISRATDRSVSIAQEGMRLDQRAWVGPTKMQADITEGKPFEFRMEIKNVGKTPALHVQAHTNPAYWSSKEKIDDSRFLSWVAGYEQMLQPGQENDLHITFDELIMTPERIAAFKNGQMWIWVRTELRYSDSFNERHKTVFCGIVNRFDLKSLDACPPGYQNAN